MRAYVLVQMERPGDSLAQSLRSIPGVLSAEDLTGAYDAIALAQTDSSRDLIDRVIAEIRRLPGVTRALPAPRIRSSERTQAKPSDERPGSAERAA